MTMRNAAFVEAVQAETLQQKRRHPIDEDKDDLVTRQAEYDTGVAAPGVFQAEVVTDDCSSSHAELPEVQATLVDEPLLRKLYDKNAAPFMSETTSTTTVTVQAIPLDKRPEFCYAQALIPDNNGGAGILLRTRPNKGGVAIAGLTASSPFQGANLCPDDHIFAVNGVACANADMAQVQELLLQATATGASLSICVHNKHGDPNLVSSSVQKPTVSAKVGVVMKTMRQRGSGVIRFTKVEKDGLFGHSLLMPLHECIIVNGFACGERHAAVNAKAVGDVIARATDRVTIVSRPQLSSCARNTNNNDNNECYAMTLALYEHTQWWKKIALTAGVAAGAAAVVRMFS